MSSESMNNDRESRESYNRPMLGDLAPLYSYMRRYRWGYVRGTLACVATNILAVQLPRILGMATDAVETAPPGSTFSSGHYS